MEVEIFGPGLFAVQVVGESRRQGVLAAAAARGGEVSAVLRPEDDNPHDPNAVRVEIEGQLCGYLPRDTARLYRGNLAAAGDARLVVRCRARIAGGFLRPDGARAYYGLKLDLPPMVEE
ncbi:MAG: hypothetical protein JNK94_02420 [Hyphomonadaceae bacterium]|nr:hypothetical protein [Hyphomonadaceae bacterium]MBX3509904.1 hypothetical protein [Hyphomonadaceae bacterium]